MKSENTTLKAINYLSIYADKSKDFDAFKYIQRSKANPLQVSYIKQEKIESLLEYTGTKIKGTAEQRKKYFVNTSINKLLNAMFTNESSRIERISQDIDTQFRKDFTGKAEFFITDDVVGYYSQENKDYIYNRNGSCMEGKPSNYFEIYNNFLNIKTQIVGLKVGSSVVARAMLWTKGTEEKKFYLDRIYISSEFKNSNEEELQLKLHTLVKRMLRVKKLDCYSAYHINRHIESNLVSVSVPSTKVFKIGDTEPPFTIQIDLDTFQRLDCYPYADTFRWGKELSTNVKFSDDEDDCDYILDNTDGYYTEGNGTMCACCDDNICDEDYIRYSECEDEYLCDDCSVYLEDREDVCREHNSMYDSYREVYVYEDDVR
tara:strand:+ start:835 stop:1956 length:1122 start_codon:yes stop_codon:yes gene_type:complete